MRPGVHYVDAVCVDGKPREHIYRVDPGAILHINGIPVRVAEEAFVASATDLRLVPDLEDAPLYDPGHVAEPLT